METKLFSKAEDFLQRAGTQLMTDEIKYGLIYGIASRLTDNPHAFGDVDPWFSTLEHEAKVCAVAMRSPPYNILLAHFSGNPVLNAASLADAVAIFSGTIPGVVGDTQIADPFVKHWCDTRKVAVTGKIAQRVYRLTQLSTVAFARGKLRLATEADKPLLVGWGHAFHHDAFAAANITVPKDDVAGKIDRKEVYVWEDNVPVAMAAKASSAGKGIRISLVYTPPQLRRKGYATSCVATLCREILASGNSFCTLYADKSNPTSNSIYQKIGFEAVCDSVEYSLA